MDAAWKAQGRRRQRELPCPFCAGRITFPLDENDEHTAVFHTLPPCRVYLETDDALDFTKRYFREIRRRLRELEHGDFCHCVECDERGR